ncbi:GAK system CofD-like protein [Thiovibrio frasassiensis]|jgi:CofD-related protein of GAK system|uniref:GAK system CofD-like protein n=1 Tax=Thiovibrio frasassiensis TaxID=2984131 RepID=A0A9X4RMH3_9BACT|nr:GAK system CofD-like protein [Thiovibrio frasassiensis]MDG4476183.1 GAK system CofD-like protein [Thiovibrio frasassiensis]
MKIKVEREITLPDPVRVELYRRTPELGPRLLFFSGGSALRGVSRELIHYTHNSCHIMTAVDSGGSSATLRQAFSMPSIGDIRARLMDLADQSVQGNPEMYRLFVYRFPTEAKNETLLAELQTMAAGRHRLVSAIPDPLRKIVRQYLKIFLARMPQGFNLLGASIGNLVLTAGYLDNGHHLDSVIFLFSKLVEARGTVRPVLNRYLHLGALLDNGQVVVGQHLLTGKEVPPLQNKIRHLFLTMTTSPTSKGEVWPRVRNKLTKLINSAQLICYPMGSFYSSVIASLLPEGVTEAIQKNVCPKIYIPSMGQDPETVGLSLMEQIETLLRYLKKNNPKIPTHQVLNCVLVDSKNGGYSGEVDPNRLMDMGIQLLDCPLVSEESTPYCEPKLLVPLLLSLS